MAKETLVKIKGLKLGKMTQTKGACIEIEFKEKKRIIGTLTVSKSKIKWTPSHKKHGIEVTTWELERILEQYEKKKKQSKK